MIQIVSRLFDNAQQALDAVEDLDRAGLGAGRISVVSANVDGLNNPMLDGTEQEGNTGDAKAAAPLTRSGAMTSGPAGGDVRLLAGLGLVAVPNLSSIAAVGWLLPAAEKARCSHGDMWELIGILRQAGHSDQEANIYCEGVRRGATLVAVKVDDERAAGVREALKARGGVDATTRCAAYLKEGWTRFDRHAQPYGPLEIERERRRYQAAEQPFATLG